MATRGISPTEFKNVCYFHVLHNKPGPLPELCGACGGSGEYIVDIQDDFLTTCKRCKGKGYE